MAGVIAIIAFFGGIFLCGAAAFGWFFLKALRDLKAAVELQVKATHELLGEGSFTRISKALSTLVGSMPDMMSGMNILASAMRAVVKAGGGEEEEAGGMRQPSGTRPPADGESAFYPGVTDQEAAVNEVAAEAARQRIAFTPEEAARAHTDEAT